MTRENELHAVTLEQRREPIANRVVRTLIAGRVRRVMYGDDLPRRIGVAECGFEPLILHLTVDVVRVEPDDEHVAETARPPTAGHSERLHLGVAVPLFYVMVPDDRE